MAVLRRLLRKNILLLLSAQFISDLGSVMQTFALSLYVLNKTNSEMAFGSVLAVAFIPRLLGPFSGAVIDRNNRKRLLVTLDIAAGIVTLGFALWHQFVLSLPLSYIYVLVLLLSTIQAFNDPAVIAIIPELTDQDSLKITNVASSIIYSTATILGPVIASVLNPGSHEGILIIMLINSCSFFAAATIETFLKNKSAFDAVRAAGESVLQSIREGLRTVFRNRELTAIVVLSIITNFALYSVISVGITLLMYKDVGASNAMLGVSRSFMYAGPFAGSLLAGVLLRKMDYRRLLTRILFLDGILLALIAAALPLAYLAGEYRFAVQFVLINMVALCIVATVMLGGIAITTTMQRIVPGHLMGRVSAVDSSCSVIAIPFGQLVFSWLSKNLGSFVTLLLFGVGVLSAAVFAHFLYKPMLQQAEAPGNGAGSDASAF